MTNVPRVESGLCTFLYCFKECHARDFSFFLSCIETTDEQALSGSQNLANNFVFVEIIQIKSAPTLFLYAKTSTEPT